MQIPGLFNTLNKLKKKRRDVRKSIGSSSWILGVQTAPTCYYAWSLKAPRVRHGIEIPTVRESGVANVTRLRFAPTIRAETTNSAVGRPGDGEKLEFLGHLVTRYFSVYSAPIRVTQRVERVHAVLVVQIVSEMNDMATNYESCTMVALSRGHLDDIAFSAEYGGTQEAHLDSGSFLKSLERISSNMLPTSVTPAWSRANIRALGVSRYENLFFKCCE